MPSQVMTSGFERAFTKVIGTSSGTCIDNGMPLCFCASDVQRTGYEGMTDLNAETELKHRIERLRIACGRAMGLGDVTSKNYPKMTLIAAPRDGGAWLPAASFRIYATTRSAC
jgi:2-methylaconitate cis-trans-isomerase PrpF